MAMLYPSGLPQAIELDTIMEERADADNLSASALLRRLQHTMHAEIPLTRTMSIRADGYDQAGLRLSAPLAPNINDKGTVFSGSLNAVVTLAGWGLIWLLLQQQHLSGTIVIQDSAIKYLRPIQHDFVARAYIPERSEIEQFQFMLRRHKRARLAIGVEICAGDTPCVTFSGRYVVNLKHLA